MPLENLLNQNLTQDNIRIYANQVYSVQIQRGVPAGKDRSLKPAKSLTEVYNLIRLVLENIEKRANTPEVNRVLFTEEEPDNEAKTESITFSLVKKVPGAFGQGAPFESNVANQKPIIREELNDPENPGYRIVNTGYWYDNIIRLTCWARTNKAANARVEWLMKILDEYSWFFKAEGVDRFLFMEQNSDIVLNIDGNKWYGRPLDYFVRTETIRSFSEKQIEEVIINFAVKS